MELIVISDTRMKIMLSKEDMSSYDIDAGTLDTDSAQTKRKLYGILERASQSAGIKSSAEGAFVRIFPSRDGGCEMYVTRFSSLSDIEGTDEECSINMSNAKGAVKRRTVFLFSHMRELLCASRELARRGYGERSDAYISKENGSLYLILFEGESDISVVLEYAEPVFFGGMFLYISEHCTPVCEGNAVETLGALC